MSLTDLKEIQEKRATVVANLQSMDAKRKQEGRTFNAEEKAVTQRYFDEEKQLRDQEETIQASNQISELRACNEEKKYTALKNASRFTKQDKINAFAGFCGVKGSDSAIYKEAAFRMGLSGQELSLKPTVTYKYEKGENHIEFSSSDNSQLSGTLGDDLVQTDVANEISVALLQYGKIRKWAKVIHTAKANPINFPVDDPTANLATLIAEDDATGPAVLAEAFGTVPTSAYKYRGKIGLTYEIMLNSVVNLQSYVTTRLAERLDRGYENAYCNATGSSQPMGVIGSGSTLPIAVTTAREIPTFVELTKAFAAIDPAYRDLDSFGLMCHDQFYWNLMLVQDPDGNYIFKPLTFEGASGDRPTTLFGKRIMVNNLLNAPGLNQFPAVLGAWEYLLIRDSDEIRFQVDPYTAMKSDVVIMYVSGFTECQLIAASTTAPLKTIKCGAAS